MALGRPLMAALIFGDKGMPEQRISKRNITSLMLLAVALVLVMQIANVIYWGMKKQGYHIDEIMTYHIANGFSSSGFLVAEQDDYKNVWHEQPLNYLMNALTVQENERFDFRGVSEITGRDVHPPAFYDAVHAVSSFMPDCFSKWTGIGPNILYFAVSQLGLFWLFSVLTGAWYLGLMVMGIYGFSPIAVSMTIFIRMYAMMIMWVVLSLCCHVGVMEKTGEKKWLLLSGGVTMMGMLTHYYFAVFQFFLSAYCCVNLLLRKEYKALASYIPAILLGLGASALCFPEMLGHVTQSVRGKEAFANWSSGQNHVTEYVKRINRDEFSNYGGHILFCVLLMRICLLLKKRHAGKDGLRWASGGAMLVIPLVGYIVMISRVAPYITERYMAVVYPVLMGAIIWALYAAIHAHVGHRAISFMLAGVLMTAVVGHCYVHKRVRYLFDGAAQDLKIAQAHADNDAIVVHGLPHDDMCIWLDMGQYDRLFVTSLDEADRFYDAVEACADQFILYFKMPDSGVEKEKSERLLREFTQNAGLETQALYKAKSGRYTAFRCTKR